MRVFILNFLIFQLFSVSLAYSETPYFPPINSDDWDTLSPYQLGWNINKIEELYRFLEEKNSKAFILLKDGTIVLEKYFDTFTKDNLWYWASAGKSLTASLVGIAQEEGFLNINDETSKYLGQSWTSLPKEKEELITIRHQLTMTTGLDYEVEDLYCTNPECLRYKADAGTQWYYHNAPYTLLEKVVEKATGMNYNLYTSQKLREQIGMNGAWIKSGFNNVYWSNARSMARFGILISNNGFWENKNIIKDKDYLNQMINTSQDLNKSYGYLWWLNGKKNFMMPGTTMVFNTMLMKDAPHDVIAALGKNGQCLNISSNKGIVWVRMGEAPDDQFFISTILSNDIWKYINKIMQSTDIINEQDESKIMVLYNPVSNNLEIKLTDSLLLFVEPKINIYNSMGECVLSESIINSNFIVKTEKLPFGLYFIQIGNYHNKFLVVR